jgi:hypothetical protein
VKKLREDEGREGGEAQARQTPLICSVAWRGVNGKHGIESAASAKYSLRLVEYAIMVNVPFKVCQF